MGFYVDDGLITGIFKAEMKNRFLCTVCVNGEDILCYVPSSFRLSNLVDLSNKHVLLKKNSSKASRTEYAVYAVKIGTDYVLLNLTQANRVIEENLNRRFFSYLGKRKKVTHEANIGGYKADLFIQDTKTLVEIKTLLSIEKTALFPSVYSERTIEQLKKISQLLDGGYKVCFLVVSLSPRVREIRIDNTFKEFWDIFQECVKKGMMVKAVALQIVGDSVDIHSQVKMVI